MAALQDIAINQFSSGAVQSIPKTLVVVSDMIEFTKDYTQYPPADLSYRRFVKSSAYPKYRTDLHSAVLNIEYIARRNVKMDTVQHIAFWKDWAVDNRGKLGIARRLQGVN
jgi:hypothetical protein